MHSRTTVGIPLLLVLLIAAACGGEDDDPGDLTAGTEANEPPLAPEQCAPFEDGGADESGGADDGGGGQSSVCVGEAFEILRFDVCNDAACALGNGDPNPDAGCFPFNPNGSLQDLEDDMCPLPLAIPAGPDELGEIPTPEACCTATAGPEAVLESCMIDCAYAACQLASEAFAQQAAQQLAEGGIGTGNAAADLQFYADQLAIPVNLQLCVDRVLLGQPLDLGDGVPNTQQAGDISNMVLELSCDVTGVTSGGDSCTETPNFEESQPRVTPVMGRSLVGS